MIALTVLPIPMSTTKLIAFSKVTVVYQAVLNHCLNAKASAEAYSKPCQTSKIERFTKIVNG